MSHRIKAAKVRQTFTMERAFLLDEISRSKTKLESFRLIYLNSGLNDIFYLILIGFAFADILLTLNKLNKNKFAQSILMPLIGFVVNALVRLIRRFSTYGPWPSSGPQWFFQWAMEHKSK